MKNSERIDISQCFYITVLRKALRVIELKHEFSIITITSLHLPPLFQSVLKPFLRTLCKLSFALLLDM
jgi:hypothetical protein